MTPKNLIYLGILFLVSILFLGGTLLYQASIYLITIGSLLILSGVIWKVIEKYKAKKKKKP